MAFHLTGAEKTKFEELKKKVAESFNAITSAVDNYNEEVDKLRDDVGTELTKYNEALAEFRDFVNGAAAEWREEYDEKSDGWKDGDNGSIADEWISTWESADLDDATLDFPAELQIEFEDHSELELPDEP
jgi:hypothetical protein